MTYNESKKMYLKYINEHINNVKKSYELYGKQLCYALDIPIYKLEIAVRTHDASKLQEEEFEAYRQYFYTADGEEKNKDLFNLAWNHHQKVNKHHPEYWVMIDNDIEGNIKILDMDNLYIAEMLLDWSAMKMKFGGSNKQYWFDNRDKKLLSENTKRKIDKIIEIFD